MKWESLTARFRVKIIQHYYRFCQDAPVLFTFGLQCAMALLRLLQLLKQILKQKVRGGQILNSTATGGGSMKGGSGALTGEDELDSDSFCWLRAS